MSNDSIQIDTVIDMESMKDFQDGKNQGPMGEVEFWSLRCNNLECIHDQLVKDVTKTMVSLLRISESGYNTLFK